MLIRSTALFYNYVIYICILNMQYNNIKVYNVNKDQKVLGLYVTFTSVKYMQYHCSYL